jgi:hypothetical protein
VSCKGTTEEKEILYGLKSQLNLSIANFLMPKMSNFSPISSLMRLSKIVKTFSACRKSLSREKEQQQQILKYLCYLQGGGRK